MSSIFRQVTNFPVNAIAAICHHIAFSLTTFWAFDVGILFHAALLLAGIATTFVWKVRYYLRMAPVLDYGRTHRKIRHDTIDYMNQRNSIRDLKHTIRGRELKQWEDLHKDTYRDVYLNTKRGRS